VIDSVDDIEGKRIRTASSAQAAFIESLGGVPQTIGAVEVNDALSRGAVDGLVQAYTGMRTFGTFDVVDSTYEIPLGNTPFLLLMNKDTWQSLPEEVKAAMDKHGGAGLAEIGGGAYDAANGEIRAGKLEDADYTITTPSQEELAALRERFQEIHMDWVEATNNGQAVYDAYLSFLESHRASGS
jgi:TRAP-type C4-dicarboxylate transport system substrate-binding protein